MSGIIGGSGSKSGIIGETEIDYEEGTWDPEYHMTGTDLTSVTYSTLNGGTYIKIGKMIHFQCYIRTIAITKDSASGNIKITGLPYVSIVDGTVEQRAGVAIGSSQNWADNAPSSCYVGAGDSSLWPYNRTAIEGGTVAGAIGDLDTGSSKNILAIGGTYQVD